MTKNTYSFLGRCTNWPKCSDGQTSRHTYHTSCSVYCEQAYLVYMSCTRPQAKTSIYHTWTSSHFHVYFVRLFVLGLLCMPCSSCSSTSTSTAYQYTYDTRKYRVLGYDRNHRWHTTQSRHKHTVSKSLRQLGFETSRYSWSFYQ